MCDNVPNFQRCDGYNAPLNTRPNALFDSSSYDASPSTELSSLSSQVDLSSLDTDPQIPLPGSFPGQSFTICWVPASRNLRGRVSKGRDTKRGPPLHQSVLFADSSHPSGISPASTRSTYDHGLEGMSSCSTLEVPQIHVTPAELPTSPVIPSPVPIHGNLAPALPNYLNYVWMLVIYNQGNPLNRKTEEQNDHVQLLEKTCSLMPEVVAKSIDRLLSDLMINISALQYHLVLELALIMSPEECWSFHNREVDHYSEAQVRDSAGEDTPAAARSPVAEKRPDVDTEKPELDPWSTELLEFVSDDRYSKKQDASFSETAKFLSQTVPDAASAFTWRSFLDTAAWNRANHSLYNATNSTMALPPATFHPIVVDKMLRLYLTGRAPLPLAHPLYQYACYDCCHLRHWSCCNGQGSRWTPPIIPPMDENSRLCTLGPHLLHSANHHSLTPGLSRNPG
ncbi:hypothetical protein PISMIDRAFT_19248 [Pisolithus microcarpus 441]|uniref:Uncharacterized protein n=1 Tax=Pisolithus microcarpus 441 TaxID=765257 RepID=A0A0C9YD86_9AGAM|nr:hypothetical protein PISMIDRAFT_19248 [Pisolithus microcarpus 441]